MRSTTRIASLAAGLILLLSLRLSAATDTWSHDDAAHLLRRAGFGGTPEQIDRIHAMGKVAAVEYLLNGPTSKPTTQPVFARIDLPAFEFSKEPDDKKAAQMTKRQDMQRVRAWWLERMCRTDKPLEEKMTLFWHGLFCSGFMEVREPEFMLQQNELFRKEAVGNYKRLAHQIVHDPAMLRYLNADQNIRGKPNENLARELMELFTMGEGNGYTETDIKEVARSLTGLAVNPKGSTFRPFRHDPDRKTIFGRTGNYGPDDVVDLIFDQPQPANYLARRLWVFFASPEPSDADLLPIARALRLTNYDLKPALRALFLNPNFYSDKVKFSLIRSPAELVAGTVRQLDMQLGQQAQRFMTESLNRMGQELFQPPNVRGWPGGEHWITSATLYTRYNICSMLVNGPGGKREALNGTSTEKLFAKLPREAAPLDVVDSAVARFLQRPLPEAKKAALVEALGTGPVRFGTRDDRRVLQMVSLLMSTPEYQMQ
ncbi:MAG TPA: DUF1800 domain-containing protein [Tepidisphaeraceae bacterium]|nr:DUF1800 domain-containing protein [Tepidisphaeraceae bacterium]